MAEEKRILRRGESNGNATTYGYRIEARSVHSPHTQIGDNVLTKEWSFVELSRGVVGVPNWLAAPARDHGLMTYTAAQALMAWIAADCEYGMAVGVEFRLAKFKCESSYTITREGASPSRSYFNEERALNIESESPTSGEPDAR